MADPEKPVLHIPTCAKCGGNVAAPSVQEGIQYPSGLEMTVVFCPNDGCHAIFNCVITGVGRKISLS